MDCVWRPLADRVWRYERGLVGLWLLAIDSRWLDLLDLRLTFVDECLAFAVKADIDQPLLVNLDL
jgi:hypothetical protein